MFKERGFFKVKRFISLQILLEWSTSVFYLFIFAVEGITTLSKNTDKPSAVGEGDAFKSSCVRLECAEGI